MFQDDSGNPDGLSGFQNEMISYVLYHNVSQSLEANTPLDYTLTWSVRANFSFWNDKSNAMAAHLGVDMNSDPTAHVVKHALNNSSSGSVVTEKEGLLSEAITAVEDLGLQALEGVASATPLGEVSMNLIRHGLHNNSLQSRPVQGEALSLGE